MSRRSKFIKRLEDLNNKEFLEFGEYVNAPFFKVDKKVRLLYSILQSHWPRMDESIIDADPRMAKLSLKLSALKTYKTKLLKTLDEYLSINYFREQKEYQQYFLLEQLRRRKFDDEFEAKYKKFDNVFVNKIHSQGLDKDHFLFKFHHEYNYLQFISEKKKSPIVGRQYEKLLHEFDSHFFSTRFFILNVVLQESIMNTKTGVKIYDGIIDLTEDMLASIEKEQFNDIPAIHVQKLSYYLLKTRKEELNHDTKNEGNYHYDTLLGYLDENHLAIPRNQSEFAYRILVNYAVNKTRTGGKETAIRLNELYIVLEKRDYFQEGNKVHTHRMKSAFIAAVKAGSHDRANELEFKYLDKIEKGKKQELKLYFKGYKLYFSSIENYEEARDYFDECWKLKGSFWIDAFTMYAKVCYDIYKENRERYYEEIVFGSLISNTIRRIEQSSKEGSNYKDSYVNFLNILKNIFDKIGLYQPTFSDISAALNNKDILISDRQWLKDRLKDLEAN